MNALAYKILLVEDDPAAADLTQTMLATNTQAVFELVIARTLAEGVALLRARAFDLLLLDLTLPDSAGLETFEKMQALDEKLAIIVMTGSDDDELALRAMHKGAQDYLIKGRTNHSLLVKSILYAIERKRIQSALHETHQETERCVQERTTELQRANQQLTQEINDRRETQLALQESNRLLQEALNEVKATQNKIIARERLHALGHMASGIAHDFNNAIAPILGFSDLLLLRPENLADQKKTLRYLELIRTAAQDASAVVTRLREFYRERDATETREAVNLNDLISKALLLTKPRWHDQAMVESVNITIETNLQRIPQLAGNAHSLQEMLTSLLLNAVESLKQEGIISLSTWSDDDKVFFQIQDNGVGMDEEARSRCMEPFYSTKGTDGFGLPTVYGILKRHGGHLEIESAEGLGTTVRIQLPISMELQPPTSVRDYSGTSLHILVADDEPLMREVIVACLAGDGHTVDVAPDGAAALKMFEPGKYNLIITDRAMPTMNGDQLALEIKAREPDIFIILLTGFGALMEAANEHPEGVDIIVAKPFTIESLRQAIRQASSPLKQTS